VTVSVSAFVQGVGYVVAGIFSFAMGLLHDATGSWAVPMILLIASTGLAVPAIVILGRRRLVDDEIAPPVVRA
jgi:MFS transporter, CP family, cyanate transporter